MTATPPPLLRLPVIRESATTSDGQPVRLPAGLTRPGSRGADGQDSALVTNVVATRTWTLSPASRSEDAPDKIDLAPDAGLLALEAADGTTIFMRADALAERLASLAQSRPELRGADATLDLAALRPRDANNRGVGEWIWRQVTALTLVPDKITDLAGEKLAELTGKAVENMAVAGASALGAKAIVWAIEQKLAGQPGLYPWRGGALDARARLDEGDPALAELIDKPGLIFIHGTGSHTLGAFGDLPGSRSWEKLFDQFEGRLFGFEHPTFSESPIDNALALVRLLPKGARISLVTHSRGGLVGDLLCLDASPDEDARLALLVGNYRPRPRERLKDKLNPIAQAELENFASQEQAKLTELIQQLRQKALRIERYVRVASPARGTSLLSDNFDLFLSGLLTLVRRFGGWTAGAAAGIASGPGAALAAKAAADKSLAFLTRVVLEIADRRLEPHLLPGIEAMLPDAPMGMLLASAPSRPGLVMGIVAGDIEGGGMIKRLGAMFTDWMFFDRANNDLVVDTASMYGGLAGQARAQAIFVRGENINHFRYFRDDSATADGRPLPAALHRWLSDDSPADLAEWTTPALPELEPPPAAATRGDAKPPEAVLVFLPGIMGSHLAANGDKIWLDPVKLAIGRLTRIAMNTDAQVSEAGFVNLAYGRLADHLSATHTLIRFAYDWRQPIADLGKKLATTLRSALADNPDKPVRILAHSMGGLVVRAAFAHDKTLWDAIVARDGGRLVMLGTPNHGAHLFVDTLLGQSDTIRTLARVDLRHDMQDILDIVAGFPGAVHLLPAPDFIDTGNTATRNYHDPQTWNTLAALNDDFWFGRRLGGKPTAELLRQARDFWFAVADTAWVRKAPERIAYVFGQSDNTPCGLREQTDANRKPTGFLLCGTPQGDGSVTWASGHLPDLPADRKWLMPVDHSGLTSTEKYFDEILALLSRGSPRKLGTLPVSRGDDADAAAVRTYRAGPPEGYPGAAEATVRLLGGRVRRTAPQGRNRVLHVSVTAMDLRFVQIPVLCGHYRGDPIAAAESVIDRYLVDGALSQRQRLGIHSGELGNATVVLMPRTPEERQRLTGRGAVVVGLGEMGKLSADGVTEAVRGGVLRYLLHASDRYGEEQPDRPQDDADPTLRLRLASLLIGSNSALQLDVGEAVKAVALGVLLANRDFDNGADRPDARRAFVAELQIVEVFRDTAISAAYAVSRLGTTLKNELQTLKQQLDTADELRFGEGMRQRLGVSPFTDYWPRLVICDADREETGCSAECYTPRFQLPLPPENLRQILRLYGCGDKVADGHLPIPTGLDEAPSPRYAGRLKFIYMSDKARAESIVQLRQPGLVEKLCESSFNSGTPTLYAPDAGFGNTMFQLLVPLEFKAAARQMDNLILMVDDSSANLPWEMLEVDGRPLVLRSRVVRQFVTPRFRRQIVRTDQLSACVIANPDTHGFHAQFGGPGWKPALGPDGQPKEDRLADLPGATREGDTVSRTLTDAGYNVTPVPSDSVAGDVFTRLFARPYRILMISAHGIHAKRAADGSYRSGVVLSDGLLLSATEIGLMENVPDLVFLSCCHLGKIGPEAGAGSNRLAYSLSRELIDMGVRCVVAAGWEVDDSAAQTFTETFFTEMAGHNASFGDAIKTARRAAFDAHPGCNTWGAYQAYGDPSFQLKVQRGAAPDNQEMHAPDELIDWLEQRRLDSRLATAGQNRKAAELKTVGFKAVAQRVKTRLKNVPETWIDLPEVQQAIGRLYGAYGREGFQPAREALLKAIGQDSTRGLVSIATIEQLANIEARQAEQISEAGPDQDLNVAASLARDAIARLESLIALSAIQPHARLEANRGASRTPERQAILGSAHKRRAIVLARSGKPWKEVAAALTVARDAYACGEGSPESTSEWNPYCSLNRLQIDILLGPTDDLQAQLARCEAAARARFERNYSFFDAVMPADTELTRWLCDKAADTDEAACQRLAVCYCSAVRSLTCTRRELDSVTAQLTIFADLLDCRAADRDTERASLLRQLAAALGKPEAPHTQADRAKGSEKDSAKP